MRERKLVTLAAQAITALLALAFVLAFLKPELIPGLRAPPPGPRAAGPVSYAEAVERAAPAVVNVYTAKLVRERPNPLLEDPFLRRFFGRLLPESRPRLQTSLGSGVIIDREGHILTNHHVIAGADEIEVALRDGRHAPARLVGSDPDTDLALLRIELPRLPVAVLGDSRRLRVGDVVLAIGNPFGVGQTVTFGIVSAVGRRGLGINTFEDFIQTDAAINPGNSGGALVDATGRVVGINSAIFSRSGGSLGIGFAIPTHIARAVAKELIAHGRVVRGWLGIQIQDLDPRLAESFGLRVAQGVVVAAVLRGGPADRAGLRPGDVILRIDGRPVRDAREALDRIAARRPGDRILLEGLRDGAPARWQATAAERPART
ncbi:MAG TPA: PDZ domain-containing protein [Chromatiales bacterium]|nr:PDZ domain-containing protein [Chromatiales bacterium]